MTPAYLEPTQESGRALVRRSGGAHSTVRRPLVNIRALAIATAAALVTACGKPHVSENQAPALPTNAPIAAAGSPSLAEIYVTNSVPVMPGTPVAIVDAAGPRLLVARAVPVNVRWKVSGPFSSPSYPAAGFVAFSLTASEWQAIQKVESLRIQPASGSQ